MTAHHNENAEHDKLSAKHVEEAVLGTLLFAPEEHDLVASRVHSDDFAFPLHQQMYQEVSEIIKQEGHLDPVTLSTRLQDSTLYHQAGGMNYLAQLMEAPATANLTAYIDLLLEYSAKRKLAQMFRQKASSLLSAPAEVDSLQIIGESEAEFEAIRDRTVRSEISDGQAIMKKVFQRMEEVRNSDDEYTGLITGFKEFDDMTGGIDDTDLIIVAGRPSMGKTTFCNNIGLSVAVNQGKAVYLYSGEMGDDRIGLSLLAAQSGVPVSKIKTGAVLEKDSLSKKAVAKAGQEIAQSRFMVDDRGGKSMSAIAAECRKLDQVHRDNGGLSLVIIDYVQLLEAEPGMHNATKNDQLTVTSRKAKALAQELKCPVILLAQLNRGVERRVDKRPVMSDLRESGALEQDADVICFLYRDEYYHPDNIEMKGIAEVIFAKQRQGPVGSIEMGFKADQVRFFSVSGDQTTAASPPTHSDDEGIQPPDNGAWDEQIHDPDAPEEATREGSSKGVDPDDVTPQGEDGAEVNSAIIDVS